MIDVNGWMRTVTGTPNEEDDPVTKALRLLSPNAAPSSPAGAAAPPPGNAGAGNNPAPPTPLASIGVQEPGTQAAYGDTFPPDDPFAADRGPHEALPNTPGSQPPLYPKPQPERHIVGPSDAAGLPQPGNMGVPTRNRPVPGVVDEWPEAQQPVPPPSPDGRNRAVPGWLEPEMGGPGWQDAPPVRGPQTTTLPQTTPDDPNLGLNRQSLVPVVNRQGQVLAYMAPEDEPEPFDNRDADNGPREAIPGSVGAQPLPPPSTYNDPEVGGTVSQPVPYGGPPWNGSSDGSGSPITTPAAAGTAPASAPTAAPTAPVTTPIARPTATGITPPSASDDPGGAVFAAQDSQSRPLPYDNRVADEEAGAREAAPGTPGRQNLVPAFGDAPDPIGSIVRPAVAAVPQASGNALDAYIDAVRQGPSAVDQIVQVVAPHFAPMFRAYSLYQAAQSAFGDTIGRQVGSALGLSDQEMTRLLGVPISEQDVAGFVGQMALDPTNFLPGTQIKPAARAAGQMVQEAADVARPAIREAGAAVGRGARAVADDLARGAMDALPSPAVIQRGGGDGLGRPAQRTVEVIREQMDAVEQAIIAAEQRGDTELAARARGFVGQLENELADAINARRRLEPAIASDVGRRADELPPLESTVDDVMDARFPRERGPMQPSDLSGPVSVPPNMAGRQNALVPFDPASAALGAGAGAASEDEEGGQGDPWRAAGGAAVAGVINFRRFPGAQRALQAAAKRQAAMAARGIKPLNPLQWTGELVKSIGYSSMIGPSTATVNLFGNMLEPLWAAPKEVTRAMLPRGLGGRGNPREVAAMAAGVFRGLGDVWPAVKDALLARGRYASNPDAPMLSERTINPLGHAVATGLELGGRVFSGVPDAIFGTVARSAGETRQAAQIATDEGLRGQAWQRRVNTLLGEVEQHRAGQLTVFPQEVDEIIKAGEGYADRQTFRDQLGTIGKGAAGLAGRNIPVLGNLIAPFFNTPWNMGVTLAERTPLGAVMNRQKGFDKWYDAVVGSALVTGLVVGPAAAGQITGSGPSDPEKRKMLEAEGWKPYHTLAGDTYVPNRVFGIYGKLLNAVGDVHDAMAYQKKDATASDMGDDALRRFGRLLKEEPYLQGMSDLLDLFGDRGTAGVQRYLASNVTRMVPYGATARTVGTAADPSEREVDRGKGVGFVQGIGQNVASGLGMRSGLPVAQNALGEPKANMQRGINAVLPKTSPRVAQPLVAAYREAGVDIASAPSDIDGVKLTPAQQRRYQAVMGQELQRLAGPTVTGATWANTPPQARKILLETYQSTARTLAELAVSGEGGQVFVDERTKAILDKALGR